MKACQNFSLRASEKSSSSRSSTVSVLNNYSDETFLFVGDIISYFFIWLHDDNIVALKIRRLPACGLKEGNLFGFYLTNFFRLLLVKVISIWRPRVASQSLIMDNVSSLQRRNFINSAASIVTSLYIVSNSL